MNDRVDQRLADIADAITAIASHLMRGDLSDGLIAVCAGGPCQAAWFVSG
ncbi:MAG TPA: hypothetical protein VLR26_04015 [Frankiaceae bacterium]|nr:hypothetical protein [Frankiaceae bacterium]